MVDLSKVKKGDFVAVVHSGGFSSATTATKAVVVKKNPASVVISHQGKEHKVNLSGQGLGYGEWVEVWDDATEEKRIQDAKLFTARTALRGFEGPMTFLPYNTITPEDVVREPAKFAELVRLRDELMARTKELAQAIVATRA